MLIHTTRVQEAILFLLCVAFIMSVDDTVISKKQKGFVACLSIAANPGLSYAHFTNGIEIIYRTAILNII